MTKIIVLTVEEEKGTPQVGINCSDGVVPQQALIVCEAAMRHFQEQVMEAEIQRRLAVQRAGGKDETNSAVVETAVVEE